MPCPIWLRESATGTPSFNLVFAEPRTIYFFVRFGAGKVEDAMRLAFRLYGTVIFGAFGAADIAFGQYMAPPGYETIPLVNSQEQPFAPNGLAVNPAGEMATLTTDPNTGNTVATLYNTWQNGRTALASITNPNWTFDTDPTFLNSSTILFGDNTSASTDALWEVNFSNPSSPAATQITVNGSLPAVQGVALLNPTTAIVSGQAASSGDLYLDSVDLTKTSGNVTTLQSGVGTGYPGLPAISPAGNDLLLEDVISGNSLVHVFPNGNPPSSISLANGNGFGAYGIAFDNAGEAFVTTGDTITTIQGIDMASPTVGQFGMDNTPDAYVTSISFTGGAFNPGEAGDTGALVINDATFGEDNDAQAYAIVVPEPASIGLIGCACAAALARRRRSR
jgi:hypothetical protein